MTLFNSFFYHHHYYFLLFLVILLLRPPTCPASGGPWTLLKSSIGISAMHMQLLPNDRVVIFDRTDTGVSNISLPNSKCRPNSNDCSAHSVEYNVATGTIRPLEVLTNVWCSSGSLMPDGRLIQTGGFDEGYRVVRIYESCDTCDWQEIINGLDQPRWYATNHLLPDGRQIIIGGIQSQNYEFYPKKSAAEKAINLPFLTQTNDINIENNLYPFVFLYPDGNLFIFANNRAILFNYSINQVIKTYPTIPGGHPRNFPSSGSAVLLPMHLKAGKVNAVEVLVCGGAPKGAFVNANKEKFDSALNTCGRIRLTNANPQWVMETMPSPRLMGDMLLLPNGQVLLINGVSAGVAGFELGRDPVLSPVTYTPENKPGSRFAIQNPSTRPRVYHSTAILLRDGRVLVGGSNAHNNYTFQNVLYPTDLSLEAFSPSYLDKSLAPSRPTIVSPASNAIINYGKFYSINFTISSGGVDLSTVGVTMVSPSFNTHSFSQNQRLLVLDSCNSAKAVGKHNYQVVVSAPPSGNVAPAGNYIIFVVHKEIPSTGIWVHMQ